MTSLGETGHARKSGEGTQPRVSHPALGLNTDQAEEKKKEKYDFPQAKVKSPFKSKISFFTKIPVTTIRFQCKRKICLT